MENYEITKQMRRHQWDRFNGLGNLKEQKRYVNKLRKDLTLLAVATAIAETILLLGIIM